jgi:hypothetical protein
MRLSRLPFLFLLLPFFGSCDREPEYDLLVRGGTLYDGTGSAGFAGDVAIKGDRIAYVGRKAPGKAKREIDATGQAVSPASSTCSPGPPSRSSSMGAARGSCARASRSK